MAKKPGFLIEIEGFKQIFGLKTPVSRYPCDRELFVS